MTFEQLHRGAPFAAKLTLYTRTNGREDPKEHLFYKLNGHKAITLDKRVTVHMPSNTWVELCQLERKPS